MGNRKEALIGNKLITEDSFVIFENSLQDTVKICF